MITEPNVEFSDHKQSKLSVGIVHDPWGIGDGEAVPTYLRISVCDAAGREAEFLVAKEIAPKLVRSIEDALKALARQ